MHRNESIFLILLLLYLSQYSIIAFKIHSINHFIQAFNLQRHHTRSLFAALKAADDNDVSEQERQGEVMDLNFLADDGEEDVISKNEENLKDSLTKSWEIGTNPILRKGIAAASSLIGCVLFALQFSQPVNGVALLHAMEKDSIALSDALCNGKPTMIEFYADWCESCKELAPVMRSLELKYKNDVNFVTLNGVNPKNLELVDLFGVDGIPHVAFISKNAEVETALVGAVPGPLMNMEVQAFVKRQELPFEGYDAFEGKQSHFPFGQTSSICPRIDQ